MSNEITPTTQKVSLPARTQALMNEWLESPKRSYDNLPEVISHEEIFQSLSPTLSQIKNHIGEERALMIISLAINDVNYLFRKDRRMDEYEIVLTSKAILRRYWYLKPEDIKKCFNGPRPKSFVLEGDSFLSWLAEYDLKRDNACEDVASNGKEADSIPDAISHAAYMAMLEARSNDGDKEASELIAEYRKRMRIPTKEEQHKKELEFFKYKQEYAKKRQQQSTIK